MLKIAIAIATAGRREVLADTVLFMRNQERPPEEFLICRARPEDADVETLRQAHPQLVTVSSPVGLCRQRNVLMAASNADVMVFFDDDFLPDADFLVEIEKLFHANPDVAIATGCVLADGIRGADKFASTIETQRSLISTLQDRVTMRSTAAAKQTDTKSSVIDATETLKYQITHEAIQQGELADAEAGAAVLEREIDKTLQGFISDNSEKLGDAERQIDDLTQKLAKATAEREHKTILSPLSGTVQESVITNVGQVVTVGQEVMRIVPDDSKLELRVYVLNTDIGFVKAGQEAVVKIQSFPFTRYGTITAKVTNVVTDAVPEPDAKELEGNPAAQISNATFAGAERTQNLVFPVTLVPDKTIMGADGHNVPLTPGMAATVEIKTDSRRILEYVFSPIVEVTSEAFKER
nr:HlyD family efflux transporter periplasmic adaptor subunit [Labrys miyagiensis]